MPHIQIAGPAGQLEARLDGDSQHVAVLCHPHPQYGGTMDDLVLEAVSRALLDAGISVLRFNFRGVGYSEGRYDDGHGEVEDVLAVCDWVGGQEMNLTVLGGYSFGAVMALQAASKRSFPQLFLVAPPVSMLNNVNLPAVPCHVVAGDQDPFVSPDGIQEAFGSMVETGQGSITIVQHADHFFHGYHQELTDIFSARL